jgi:transcriptional regulator with XRE-family HTH domain
MKLTGPGSTVIRRARHRRQLGIRELAALAGVSKGAVIYWEHSEFHGKIRDVTLERALKAMGTSFHDEQMADIRMSHLTA